ncbi:MAG: alanine racemase, partial [Brevinematales bacterium]
GNTPDNPQPWSAASYMPSLRPKSPASRCRASRASSNRGVWLHNPALPRRRGCGEPSGTPCHPCVPSERCFIAKIKELPNLSIEGLMTIGPLTDDKKAIRQAFALLRKIRDKAQKWFPHALQLSMGMSDDFLLAIEEGSTMIRLGRVLFGSRQ